MDTRFFISYIDELKEKRRECISHLTAEYLLILLAKNKKEATVFNHYGEICGRVEKIDDAHWRWWIFCV